MKKFTGVKFLKKIVIAFLTIILLFQFMMPIRSEAIPFVDMELPEVPDVFRFMAQIVAGIGDIGMSMFNNAMLGTSGYGTAMISHETLDKSNSWFVNGYEEEQKDGSTKKYEISTDGKTPTFDENETVVIGEDSSGKNIVVYVKDGTLEKNIIADSDEWEVPNMLYCPENIFGNNIAMLDVNFLNPNDYQAVVDTDRGNKHAKSIAGELKTTIKSWYRTLRNLAIVALLSILVYLGIRILLSSTAEDKAKHKEILKDWFIALVLIFLMHFIMSAIIMIVNQINGLFKNLNESIYVQYDGSIFRSNFTGVMRFLAQSTSVNQAWAYSAIYWVLILYTFIFTVQYLRRVLYIAFYTMISPLVAITYPLDKLGDGKSQAFNKWFKEYTMTMALQPIHLIIYTMVVSTTLSLSIQNPIFALVAIGFLIPAEQFIRGLFGVESKADAGFGSFASGALTMQALNSLRKPKFGGANGKGNKGESDSDTEEDTKVRQASNKELDYWKNNSANNNQNNQAEQNEQDEDNEVPPDFSFGNNNPWANENNDTYQEDNDNPDGTIDLGNNGANQGQDNNNNDEEQERVRMNAQQQGNEPDEENGNEQANEVQHELTPQEKFDNMRKMRRRQFGRKAKITGVKVLKNAAKFTAKGVGAVTFGTIGLASGIASGKGIGETIKRTSIGAAAGVAVGTTATNLVGKTYNGAKAVDGAVQTYRQNLAKDYKNAGLENDKSRRVQEQLSNRAKKSKNYDKIIDEYAMKNGRDIDKKQRKELREKIYDYETSYGVTEKDDIKKALQMEEKYLSKFGNDKEDTHKRIGEIMQLKNSYGREFINNKSKIEEFDNNLTNRGITGNDKELIKELFYDAHGAKYKRARTGNTGNVGNNGNNGNAGQQ